MAARSVATVLAFPVVLVRGTDSAWVSGKSWNISGHCVIDPEDEDCVQTPHWSTNASELKPYPAIDRCYMQPITNTSRVLEIKNLTALGDHDSNGLDVRNTTSGDDRQNWKFDLMTDYADARPHGAIINNDTHLKWFTDNKPHENAAAWGFRVCSRPAGRVWAAIGPCQIDEDDDECISSPNFPSTTETEEGADVCSFRLRQPGKRRLEVTTWAFPRSGNRLEILQRAVTREWVVILVLSWFGTGWSTNAGTLQGRTIDESDRIYWVAQPNRTGLPGWRLCARTNSTWQFPNMTVPGVDQADWALAQTTTSILSSAVTTSQGEFSSMFSSGAGLTGVWSIVATAAVVIVVVTTMVLLLLLMKKRGISAAHQKLLPVVSTSEAESFTAPTADEP